MQFLFIWLNFKLMTYEKVRIVCPVRFFVLALSGSYSVMFFSHSKLALAIISQPEMIQRTGRTLFGKVCAAFYSIY